MVRSFISLHVKDAVDYTTDAKYVQEGTTLEAVEKLVKSRQPLLSPAVVL